MEKEYFETNDNLTENELAALLSPSKDSDPFLRIETITNLLEKTQDFKDKLHNISLDDNYSGFARIRSIQLLQRYVPKYQAHVETIEDIKGFLGIEIIPLVENDSSDDHHAPEELSSFLSKTLLSLPSDKNILTDICTNTEYDVYARQRLVVIAAQLEGGNRWLDFYGEELDQRFNGLL